MKKNLIFKTLKTNNLIAKIKTKIIITDIKTYSNKTKKTNYKKMSLKIKNLIDQKIYLQVIFKI